jgi:hypothetical protein
VVMFIPSRCYPPPASVEAATRSRERSFIDHPRARARTAPSAGV